MADEPKQPWYKSIPGILTAATGLIAALSGLVAGLNQLGVFRREPPAAVVGMTPAPADNTAPDSAPGAAAAQDSATIRATPTPTAALRPAVPAAAPPQPTAGANRSPSPAPTRSPSPADTAATGSILIPKGTALSLTVPARSCAPADGARRVTARLATPVDVNGVPVLAVGTAVVLRLRRGGDPPAPRARLDSLVHSGRALPISSAQVQIPRGSVSGFCLRAGARLSVVLGEAVAVPRT